MAGALVSLLLLFDLLWNYRKVDRLKKEIERVWEKSQ
jgi:hypothetical protein